VYRKKEIIEHNYEIVNVLYAAKATYLTKIRWWSKASTVTHCFDVVLSNRRICIQYAPGVPSGSDDVRFALPCKCGRNNLFKCKSLTILWIRICNIYVLYVFDTLPQQLMENHFKSQKHSQSIIANTFR